MNSVFVPCTVKSCDFTFHAQEKKKLKNVSAQFKRAHYLHKLYAETNVYPFFFFNKKNNLSLFVVGNKLIYNGITCTKIKVFFFL